LWPVFVPDDVVKACGILHLCVAIIWLSEAEHTVYVVRLRHPLLHHVGCNSSKSLGQLYRNFIFFTMLCP